MSEFKPGDRVVVVADNMDDGLLVGATGEVDEQSSIGPGVWVILDDLLDGLQIFSPDELERVSGED